MIQKILLILIDPKLGLTVSLVYRKNTHLSPGDWASDNPQLLLPTHIGTWNCIMFDALNR